MPDRRRRGQRSIKCLAGGGRGILDSSSSRGHSLKSHRMRRRNEQQQPKRCKVAAPARTSAERPRQLPPNIGASSMLACCPVAGRPSATARRLRAAAASCVSVAAACCRRALSPAAAASGCSAADAAAALAASAASSAWPSASTESDTAGQLRTCSARSSSHGSCNRSTCQLLGLSAWTCSTARRATAMPPVIGLCKGNCSYPKNAETN